MFIVFCHDFHLSILECKVIKTTAKDTEIFKFYSSFVPFAKYGTTRSSIFVTQNFPIPFAVDSTCKRCFCLFGLLYMLLLLLLLLLLQFYDNKYNPEKHVLASCGSIWFLSLSAHARILSIQSAKTLQISIYFNRLKATKSRKQFSQLYLTSFARDRRTR